MSKSNISNICKSLESWYLDFWCKRTKALQKENCSVHAYVSEYRQSKLEFVCSLC